MRERGIEKYRVISSEGIRPPSKSEKLALFNLDGTPYSPGGAFDHLAEVDQGLYYDLEADYRRVRIFKSDQPAAGKQDLSGSSVYAYLHPGNANPNNSVYELWPDEGNGNNPIFQWNENGSLHWGDGTAAQDLSIFRREVAGKTQLVCNAAGTEVILAAEA